MSNLWYSAVPENIRLVFDLNLLIDGPQRSAVAHTHLNDAQRPKLSDVGHEARGLEQQRNAAIRCSAWLGFSRFKTDGAFTAQKYSSCAIVETLVPVGHS